MPFGKGPAPVGGAAAVSREIEDMRLYYMAFLRERLSALSVILSQGGPTPGTPSARRQPAVPTDLAQDDDFYNSL